MKSDCSSRALLLCFTLYFFGFLCSNTENQSKYVRLQLLDNSHVLFPDCVVRDLFVLPASYCSSSSHSIVSKQPPSEVQVRDSYLVSTDLKTFISLMFSIFNIYQQSLVHRYCSTNDKVSVSFNLDPSFILCHSDRYSMNDEQYSKHILSFRKPYFYSFYGILKNIFSKEEGFASWLHNFCKFYMFYEYSPLTYNEIAKKWYLNIRYLIPITFFNHIVFEYAPQEVNSYEEFIPLLNQTKSIGSGTNASCYPIKSIQSIDGTCVIKKPLLKHLKNSETLGSRSLTFVLNEYLIFQKAHLADMKNINSILSIVVKSQKDFTVVGFLMEEAEYGDLGKFLHYNPHQLNDKLFEELFEIAKAIEKLHKHKIIHLDIKLNNILVQKVEESSLSGHDSSKINYQLILSDFGLSRFLGQDLSFNDDFDIKAEMYAPELFKDCSNRPRVGTYTDWYAFGKMLLAIARYFTDVDSAVKYFELFSPLIENLTKLQYDKRAGFQEVKSVFDSILSDKNAKLCKNISIKHTSGNEVRDDKSKSSETPFLVHHLSIKSLDLESKSNRKSSTMHQLNNETIYNIAGTKRTYSDISDNSLYNIPERHSTNKKMKINLEVDTSNVSTSLNNHLDLRSKPPLLSVDNSKDTKCATTSIENYQKSSSSHSRNLQIFYFKKNFPYLIASEQTNFEKKFFHKGSFLILHTSSEYSFTFYDRSSLSTSNVFAKNVAEIIYAINSCCKDCLISLEDFINSKNK